MKGTPDPEYISPELRRVAQLAREAPELAFNTLGHHLTPDLLRAAYTKTRKNGAVGIDGQTAADYGQNLRANLADLLERAKSGLYRAPPVRRVHIPKGDGRSTRPIGIPTFEDKVLQRAVKMVLEPIYEQDFLPCSHGFRPKRSAHDALSTLRNGLMEMKGGWVLEADIRDCFGALDFAVLRNILRRRIRDGVLLRLIGKWLKAGVMEEGRLSHPISGTPQGGVVSPLLANVYLHAVLDTWWKEDVLPVMRGPAFLVRYADDFVFVFAREDDARRVNAVLAKRFAKFGLTLHPEKTRLFAFRRPRGGDDDPASFDFLGFTHYWGVSRRGNRIIRQKTARNRLRRAIRRIHLWCRNHRHDSIKDQHAQLCKKIGGHCQYYGLTGNWHALANFHHQLKRAWRKWLCRRSNAARKPWTWFERVLVYYPLKPPRVTRSIFLTDARP